MDIDEEKIGRWPNVAVEPGKMGEYVNSLIDRIDELESLAADMYRLLLDVPMCSVEMGGLPGRLKELGIV